MTGELCLHLIDRATAKRMGLKRYFTGAPCPRGHISQRITDRANCLQCKRDASAKHHKANEASIRERQLAYYDLNREEVNRKALAWYHRNDRNREKNANNCRFRRARRKMAVPSWYSELDEFVIAEAGELARQRTSETGIPWHVDHMIPLRARKASGLHCAGNIQVIPAAMNLEKKNRMILTLPGEWLVSAPRLELGTR